MQRVVQQHAEKTIHIINVPNKMTLATIKAKQLQFDKQ